MFDQSFFMAHGAGAGHTSEFLKCFSTAFKRKINLSYNEVTFQYMQKMEKEGRRLPPTKFEKLVVEFKSYFQEHMSEKGNIVAGKSMGGRVATQLTDLAEVAGVVCFGFPFHPIGKQDKHRLAFLAELKKPCLIFQGTRDAFGNQEWVSQHDLPELVTIKWIEGANHDFKVLKSLNKTQDEVIEEMMIELDQWQKKVFSI